MCLYLSFDSPSITCQCCCSLPLSALLISYGVGTFPLARVWVMVSCTSVSETMR